MTHDIYNVCIGLTDIHKYVAHFFPSKQLKFPLRKSVIHNKRKGKYNFEIDNFFLFLSYAPVFFS